MLLLENLIMYLRKSRSDDISMSVEDVLAKHEGIIQEYCEREFGARLPENRIFREVVSGETIADRPVMKEIMKLLETGTVKGVLVVEPQRLSRGDLEDCGRIINTFRYTGTLVITPQKTYDLTNEYDRKFFEMELTRGNDYLEYTKRILSRGREASVKQGNFIGSIAPYGYKKIVVGSGKDKYHSLEINPEEADAVRLMYALFINEGYGFAKIAHRLDELGFKPRSSENWQPAAIKDMLENPVYIGKIRWNWRKTQKRMANGEVVKVRPKTKDPSEWILVDGKHPAIISEELYNAALERRGKNPCVRKSLELTNPYAGLLFCGTCGRAMSQKRFINRRTHTQSVCDSMLCNNQANCHTKSVKYSAFEQRVIELLEDAVADFEIKLKDNNTNVIELHRGIIQKHMRELERLHEKDMRQKDAYEDGIYTKEEYIKRNALIQEQIAKTTSALEEAKTSAPKAIDYAEKIKRFNDCKNALKDPDVSAPEKNTLLKNCVKRIDYYNEGESKPGVGRYVENVFELNMLLNM